MGRRLVLLLVVLWITFVPSLPALAMGSSDLERQLASKQGIADLMPAFRDGQGQFRVPDPTKDPQAFLKAQQTLTILIDQAESQALNRLSPKELQRRMSGSPTRLPPVWRRSEIAVRTDGQAADCADSGPKCSAYGSASFLNTLEPVKGLERSFYRSVSSDGSVPALVYLQPTAVPSVSRILLAAANSAGVWIPAAYALGPPGGDAFLIVNNCLDLAQEENGALKPAAMLVAALQWVD
ncbi:hypothetical protein SynPROS71_00181 [Synechococcus sp. PROS-7-1]|uniref:hypothetical protein n=1 Tax=Synechococcus sp. PROS-7-1 TaxID=1442556 RepID=UPI001644519D|nr:hypothetical protein [Synechococcus sp. PROS-7-1]QNI84020.1 hypothetical protein SynPROS71_00181 [Synechococcus sp. PROS-7-1]